MAGPWERFKEAATSSGPWNKFGAAGAAPDSAPVEQSYVAGLARSALGQGTLFGFGDEAMAGLRAIGDETYDDALKDERAKVSSFRNENPGTALGGELIGSLATPGLGLVAGAIKPAATVLGRIAQGSKLGAGLGGAYGFASGEGGDGSILDQAYNRGKSALKGAGAGAVVGGAIPAAGAVIGGALQKTKDFVSPGITRMTKGIEGAADDVQASRMRAAGETPQQYRNELSDAARAGTYYGGGKSASITESPLGIADLSPAMTKLGGSAIRSSPDAAKKAEAFLSVRQTGVTPKSEIMQEALQGTGIAHRNPLSPLDKTAEPSGQYERVKDALTRTLTLEDKDFHKFGENAYRTEQAMMAKLKEESNKLYGEARTAAQNFNVAPVIEPIVAKFAQGADQLPIGEATLVRRALRQFTTGNGNIVTNLDGFDKAKRAVDGLIGRARTAGDKNTERVLTGVKNELIDAVDAIKNQGVGEKYKAARNYYSSQMDMKDAIDLGRAALKEKSEVIADQFKALSEGQKKLFRLGLVESFESNMGRAKRTNDIIQQFETPRVQDLLREVIPRTVTATGRVKKGATYADRPERFGDFIANEKTMVGTKNKNLGGSQTQDKAMDDAAFTRASLGQMVDRLRLSGGITGVVMEAAATGLNKVFGMREDVAAEIGRRLYTANPTERERILQRLEQRMGKDKMSSFLSFMSKASMLGGSAVSGQAGQAAAE